jgi:hypothetical protein
MAPITITPERVAQVEATVKRIVDSFERPITSMDEYTSVFDPDVHWYDHAFLVCRVGHEAVAGLHKSWTHCNQPFRTDIKVRMPVPFCHPSQARDWFSTQARIY